MPCLLYTSTTERLFTEARTHNAYLSTPLRTSACWP